MPHSSLNKSEFHSNPLVVVLLWLSICTALAISIFTLIEDLCLATACSDAASFTFFGVGIGWLGIAYFSLILLLLWLRKKVCWFDWMLASMIFSGVGAEFRLLWIQKYIIGSWCPLCVSICCALYFAAALLFFEKILKARSEYGGGKNFFVWFAFILAMITIGLIMAGAGVKALT